MNHGIAQQPPRQLYSIKDVLAEQFGPIYPATNHNDALRAFGREVNREGSELGKSPEDFILHHIGAINPNTGELLPSIPFALGTASSMLKQPLG